MTSSQWRDTSVHGHANSANVHEAVHQFCDICVKALCHQTKDVTVSVCICMHIISLYFMTYYMYYIATDTS